MFSQLAEKFGTFSEHHQVMITAVIAVIIIVSSWSIEKILETYLPNRSTSYIVTLSISFISLWLIKHFILHVW